MAGAKWEAMSRQRPVQLQRLPGDPVPGELLEHPLPARPPHPGGEPRVLEEPRDRASELDGIPRRHEEARFPVYDAPLYPPDRRRRPFSQATTSSLNPPPGVATTGVSHAIASKLMMPNGS